MDGINLFPGAASAAFSASAWIKLTSLGTSYSSRAIVRKNSFMLFQLSTLAGTGKNYAVRPLGLFGRVCRACRVRRRACVVSFVCGCLT